MNEPASGWLGRIRRALLPDLAPATDQPAAPTLSNARILDELKANFIASVQHESVGRALLFNAHYLIVLHPDTYEDRLYSLKAVAKQAVLVFKEQIEQYRATYPDVEPVASHWYFKFSGAEEFRGEVIQPGDLRVVGTLTGQLPGRGGSAASTNVKATQRVKQTNRFEQIDFNLAAFGPIDFSDLGQHTEPITDGTNVPRPATATPLIAQQTKPVFRPPMGIFATIEGHMGDTGENFSYDMHDREIVIARREPDNEAYPNYLRIGSGYVSNPHARIRYDDASGTFQLAAYSRHETRIDGQVIPPSDAANPQWHPLPKSAQILLNGMVTIKFNGER
jgi:hypothetical protein